jgi:hypothetical protein
MIFNHSFFRGVRRCGGIGILLNSFKLVYKLVIAHELIDGDDREIKAHAVCFSFNNFSA